MSKPVYALCELIEKKIGFLLSACASLNENKEAASHRTALQTINETLEQHTISFMHRSKGSGVDTAHISNEFIQSLVAEGVFAQLEQIQDSLSKYISNDGVKSAIDSYKSINIDTSAQKIDYKICKLCGSQRTIYPHTSEIRCSNKDCREIEKLKGIVFEETQYFTSDTSNSQLAAQRRGTHETNKHCKNHLDKILALVPVTLPPELDQKIDEWMARHSYNHPLKKTCEAFRKCFKDIGQSATQYNDFIPSIRFQKTGISPQKLTQEEMRKVYIYFDAVVHAKGVIEVDSTRGSRNMKYYPFFIRKILEIILCEKKDAERLKSIVENIHFQKTHTTIANDKLWEQICNIVPAFKGKFRKTQ